MNKKIVKLVRLFYTFDFKMHQYSFTEDKQFWVIFENNANPQIVWGYHHHNE